MRARVGGEEREEKRKKKKMKHSKNTREIQINGKKNNFYLPIVNWFNK